MSKGSTHGPEFKARVAMEAISGRKTIQEIAAHHAVHPIQVSQWKKQLQERASELFTRARNSLSCSDARELRKLVDHDHPERSVSRQCALLGLSR